MGVGVRSFLIGDDGAVRRVPWSRMTRLFRGESSESFAEHAGCQLRCAIVYLEFLDRRPARVLRTEFSVLYFDDRGVLDQEVQSQQLRLIGESLDGALAGKSGNVVDIRPRIAKKLYRERFEWTPTEDELATIIQKCL